MSEPMDCRDLRAELDSAQIGLRAIEALLGMLDHELQRRAVLVLGGASAVSEPMNTKVTDEMREHMFTKEPQWTCPRCQFVNAGFREICRMCKLDSAQMSEGHYFGGKAGE